MGRQRKARLARRQWRQTAEALERGGVAERVRQATLGLRREDVQLEIHDVATRPAEWEKRRSFVDVASAALRSRGYDLEGVEISAHFLPSRVPTEPGRLVIAADVAPDVLNAARREVGAPPLLPTPATVN